MRRTLWLIFLSACSFGPTPPERAVIVCDDDAACPENQVCVTSLRVCAPRGADEGGRIVSARFEPRFARAGQLVELVVESDRAFDDEPTLRGDALPLVFQEVAGSTARWTVLIDDELTGAFQIERVIWSAGGAPIDSPLADTVLFIDNASPIVSVTLTPNPAEVTLADVGANTELTVRLTGDEPLRDVEVSLGDDASCGGGDFEIECTVDLTNVALVDGENPLRVRAFDRAGNESERVLQVAVDIAAPEVVAVPRVEVVRAGQFLQSLTLGAELFVTVLTDELTASEPRLRLTGTALEVGPSAQTGTTLEFALRIDEALPAANYTLELDVDDAVGHLATRTLLLPPPFAGGLPFDPEAGLESCTIPSANGPLCGDVDGDGSNNPAGCDDPLALDCDDREPRRAPHLVEVPGDGLDNNCDGADLTPSEALGYFVDPSAPAGGTGSRSAPLSRWQDVVDAQSNAPLPFVFAAEGILPFASNFSYAFSVVGGLDPANGWTRTNPQSRTTLAGPDTTVIAAAIGDSGQVLSGLIFDSDVVVTLGGDLFVMDVDVQRGNSAHTLDGTGTAPGLYAVNLDINITRADDGGVLRLIDSRIGEIDASSVSATLVRTVVFRSNDTEWQESSVDYVNSAQLGELIVRGASVRLIQSVLRVGNDTPLRVDGDGNVTFINTVVEGNASRPLLDLTDAVGDGGYRFIGALLGGATEIDESGAPLSVENACLSSICAGATGVSLGTWEAGLDELHLGSAVSPALGSGVDLYTEVDPLSLPRSAVADVDGTCRAGRRDIGPDSL